MTIAAAVGLVLASAVGVEEIAFAGFAGYAAYEILKKGAPPSEAFKQAEALEKEIEP